MLMRFIDSCNKYKIFDIAVADKIGVVAAVSGGADSLALADLLNRSQRRFNLNICIAHFEHGLRGEESMADAEFVRQFADERGIKFIVESGDVKTFAESNKLSIETAARELRYKFLESVRKKLNFDIIALAHHADDQAETILMRMLRGSGSIGLAAMQIKSERLIRPLLPFKKVELEAYCQSRNIIPRIDSTNFETEATRNKIRLELLPKLKEYNPAIVETLCRLGAATTADADFIQIEAAKIFPSVTRITDKIEISSTLVKKYHVAIQRALIRLFVEKSIGSVKDFEFIHFDSIQRVLTENLKGVELPHKFRADLKKGWLSISKKSSQ